MKKHGRTQRDIAEKIGCSIRTLRRRLAGTHPWPLDEALAFVKMTARSKRPITLAELVGESAARRTTTETH